ncbi:hypothetical protein PVAG01_10108 [Phlyctema vagabunda]|uniref:Uncharacterized protein n=1 Tax=Phlyctema vagabunda TaxID=108571 RepID=A0ABR4P560_9HELO
MQARLSQRPVSIGELADREKAVSEMQKVTKACPACAEDIHITKTTTKIFRGERTTAFLMFEQQRPDLDQNWVSVQWHEGPLPGCHQSLEGVRTVGLGNMTCLFCKKKIAIMQRRLEDPNSMVKSRNYCSLRVDSTETSTADGDLGTVPQYDDTPPEYTRRGVTQHIGEDMPLD